MRCEGRTAALTYRCLDGADRADDVSLVGKNSRRSYSCLDTHDILDGQLGHAVQPPPLEAHLWCQWWGDKGGEEGEEADRGAAPVV